MSSHAPSEHVGRLVADRTTVDLPELSPLSHTIGPETLDASVPALDGEKIPFRRAGHAVTVRSDGAVDVNDEPTRGEVQADAREDD